MNKFCINCKHHRKVYDGGATYECHYPNAVEVQVNMVTGQKTVKAQRCGTMRDPRNSGYDFCGVEGLWYEKKN